MLQQPLQGVPASSADSAGEAQGDVDGAECRGDLGARPANEKFLSGNTNYIELQRSKYEQNKISREPYEKQASTGVASFIETERIHLFVPLAGLRNPAFR